VAELHSAKPSKRNNTLVSCNFVHRSSIQSSRPKLGALELIGLVVEARLGVLSCKRAGSCNRTVFMALTGDVGDMVAPPCKESPMLGAV